MGDDNKLIKSITFRQAKELVRGDIIYQIGEYNYDGTAKRWRVNGKVRLWKTMPKRIEVPLSRGKFWFGQLNNLNMHKYSLEEPPKIGRARQGKPV